MDAESVQSFIQMLASLRVSEFVKDVATPADLPQYGLATPSRQIILRSAVGDTNAIIAQLLFGAPGRMKYLSGVAMKILFMPSARKNSATCPQGRPGSFVNGIFGILQKRTSQKSLYTKTAKPWKCSTTGQTNGPWPRCRRALSYRGKSNTSRKTSAA